MACSKHRDFFEDSCPQCKEEYNLFKGMGDKEDNHYKQNKRYEEFSEEKAKQLYEKLFMYYLKKRGDELFASNLAKNIIRKQCLVRKMPYWSWLRL